MQGDQSELYDQPVYERGQKVISQKDVRNDGTYPGAKMGQVLIRKGDVGYIHSVGTYLNRFYVYGVEFYEKDMVVGMRAHELEGIAS